MPHTGFVDHHEFDRLRVKIRLWLLWQTELEPPSRSVCWGVHQRAHR